MPSEGPDMPQVAKPHQPPCQPPLSASIPCTSMLLCPLSHCCTSGCLRLVASLVTQWLPAEYPPSQPPHCHSWQTASARPYPMLHPCCTNFADQFSYFSSSDSSLPSLHGVRAAMVAHQPNLQLAWLRPPCHTHLLCQDSRTLSPQLMTSTQHGLHCRHLQIW